MKIPLDVYESIGKSRSRRYIPRKRGVFSLSSNAHVMRTPSLAEQEGTASATPNSVDASGQDRTGSPGDTLDSSNEKEQ